LHARVADDDGKGAANGKGLDGWLRSKYTGLAKVITVLSMPEGVPW